MLPLTGDGVGLGDQVQEDAGAARLLYYTADYYNLKYNFVKGKKVTNFASKRVNFAKRLQVRREICYAGGNARNCTSCVANQLRKAPAHHQAGDLARDPLGGGLAHVCLFSFGGLAGLILAAVGLGLGALLNPEVEVQAVHVGEGADVLDDVLLFRCFLLRLLVGEQA